MPGQVFLPVLAGLVAGIVLFRSGAHCRPEEGQMMTYEPDRIVIVEATGGMAARSEETVVLAGDRALDFLRRRWPELYAAAPDATPYQAPEWLLGWAEQPPTTSTTLVIAAYLGGDLAAALALTRVRRGRRYEVRPLGSPHAEDVRVLGPGAEDPEICGRLVSVLDAWRRYGDQVVVPDLPGASALGRALIAAPGWEHSEAGYARVPLPLDLGAMPKATRKVHRRRARRLEALAGEGHHIGYRRSRTTDGTDGLVAAYRELAYLYERQWGVPPPEAESWPGLLRRCGPSVAFVATLTLDHRPVAAQLCLVRGRTCYSLRTARTPDRGRLSFGHALLRRLATDLAEDGFTALDLGRTVPEQRAYKEEYCPAWTAALTVRSVTPDGPHPGGPHRVPAARSTAVPRP